MTRGGVQGDKEGRVTRGKVQGDKEGERQGGGGCKVTRRKVGCDKWGAWERRRG